MLQKPVIERLIPKLAQPKIGPHLEVPPFLVSLLKVRKEIREEQSPLYSFRCTMRFASHARGLALAGLHKLNKPFYSTPCIAWNHKGTLGSDDTLSHFLRPHNAR